MFLMNAAALAEAAVGVAVSKSYRRAERREQ